MMLPPRPLPDRQPEPGSGLGPGPAGSDAVQLREDLARAQDSLRVALAGLVELRAERDAYWSALNDARTLVRSWAVLLARVDRLLGRPEREREHVPGKRGAT